MTSFVDRCIFLPVSVGTGSFVVASAVNGFLTPFQANAVNMGTYSYSAELRDSNNVIQAWEVGTGIYTTSSTTLTRSPEFSSNGNAVVSFTSPPQVRITVLGADVNQSMNITRSQITTSKVSSNAIVVAGTSSIGDVGAGAIYSNNGATSGSPNAIQDASGTWFGQVQNMDVYAGTIYATTATITAIRAATATITTLTAGTATVTSLGATTATITTLNAATIIATTFSSSSTITSVNAATLTAATGTITALTAATTTITTANVATLVATTATITTLNATTIIGTTATLTALNAGTIVATGKITSNSPIAGIGYSTGAGATVAQISSRTTAVTLNNVTGRIVLVSAAGTTAPTSFTVNNSVVSTTDTIVVNQVAGTDRYTIDVTNVGAGSFEITSNTKSGSTTEQPVFSYGIIRGVIS